MKLIKTMSEQKAKFVKNCDEKNMKAVAKIMGAGTSSAVAAGKEILDDICKFIKADKEATYNSKDGAAIFESA